MRPRRAAALRHPNIITIYASGEHEHQPFMVMEFIDGESLAEIIRNRADIPIVDKLSYLEQVCAGLHFAHRCGIIHRDIKPANVMVDKEGMVRILDFGIARIEGSVMTQGGALIGSVNYMSPEQMLGRPIDHRSDIFSVGSLAYELISYQQAFKGGLNDGLLQRLPYEHPPSLSEVCPGLPAGLEGIIVRALQKAPEDRFEDLAEMREAILDILQRLESAGDQSTVMILREALQASLDTPAPASTWAPSARGASTCSAGCSARACGGPHSVAGTPGERAVPRGAANGGDSSGAAADASTTDVAGQEEDGHASQPGQGNPDGVICASDVATAKHHDRKTGQHADSAATGGAALVLGFTEMGGGVRRGGGPRGGSCGRDTVSQQDTTGSSRRSAAGHRGGDGALSNRLQEPRPERSPGGIPCASAGDAEDASADIHRLPGLRPDVRPDGGRADAHERRRGRRTQHPHMYPEDGRA